MRVFGECAPGKGEVSHNGGALPLCSLPALATSLLRLSSIELPEAPLLCALEAGPRALLAGASLGGHLAGSKLGLRAWAGAGIAHEMLGSCIFSIFSSLRHCAGNAA